MKPQTESQIQKDCVKWFREKYPTIEPLFLLCPMVVQEMPGPQRS